MVLLSFRLLILLKYAEMSNHLQESEKDMVLYILILCMECLLQSE